MAVGPIAARRSDGCGGEDVAGEGEAGGESEGEGEREGASCGTAMAAAPASGTDVDG
jgi:hypothetical protein